MVSPRRSERVRHAAAPTTFENFCAGISRARCRFIRRGPALVSVQDTLPHRPQVFRVRDVASFDVGQLFKPPKNTQDQAPTKASAVKVGFRRRSEPATLPRRPHASNSCSTDHLAHSRLLGVIIPQAQEFAISGNVYRGLVGVLIRGPCLEQSASLQLCVWYTFCR